MHINTPLLERILTRHFGLTLIGVSTVVVATAALLLYSGAVSLDSISKGTDALLKLLAILVGAAWTLNRHFIGRIDAPQLRVDASISHLPSSAFGNGATVGLMAFRLDLVNTGKTLLGRFDHYVQVDRLSPSATAVEKTPLWRWPKTDMHPGGPVEPGSWSAVNAAFPLPDDVRAIRLFVMVAFHNGKQWTWHRTYLLPAGGSAAELAS